MKQGLDGLDPHFKSFATMEAFLIYSVLVFGCYTLPTATHVTFPGCNVDETYVVLSKITPPLPKNVALLASREAWLSAYSSRGVVLRWPAFTGQHADLHSAERVVLLNKKGVEALQKLLTSLPAPEPAVSLLSPPPIPAPAASSSLPRQQSPPSPDESGSTNTSESVVEVRAVSSACILPHCLTAAGRIF